MVSFVHVGQHTSMSILVFVLYIPRHLCAIVSHVGSSGFGHGTALKKTRRLTSVDSVCCCRSSSPLHKSCRQDISCLAARAEAIMVARKACVMHTSKWTCSTLSGRLPSLRCGRMGAKCLLKLGRFLCAPHSSTRCKELGAPNL